MIPSYSTRAPRVEHRVIGGENRGEAASPHRRENLIACSPCMITGRAMATGFRDSLIPGGCARDGELGALDAPMLIPGGSAQSSPTTLLPSVSLGRVR